MGWSDDDIATLCDFYRENRGLWHILDKLYHNRNYRTKKLVELKDLLNRKYTEQEIKQKFHGLQCTFNKHHKKIEAAERSGAGSDDIPEPSVWKYYELLDFLADRQLKPATSQSSLPSYDDEELSSPTAPPPTTSSVDAAVDAGSQSESAEPVPNGSDTAEDSSVSITQPNVDTDTNPETPPVAPQTSSNVQQFTPNLPTRALRKRAAPRSVTPDALTAKGDLYQTLNEHLKRKEDCHDKFGSLMAELSRTIAGKHGVDVSQQAMIQAQLALSPYLTPAPRQGQQHPQSTPAGPSTPAYGPPPQPSQPTAAMYESDPGYRTEGDHIVYTDLRRL